MFRRVLFLRAVIRVPAKKWAGSTALLAKEPAPFLSARGGERAGEMIRYEIDRYGAGISHNEYA
jgi:hypothetical protein